MPRERSTLKFTWIQQVTVDQIWLAPIDAVIKECQHDGGLSRSVTPCGVHAKTRGERRLP
jgi:hypothetical protein